MLHLYYRDSTLNITVISYFMLLAVFLCWLGVGLQLMVNMDDADKRLAKTIECLEKLMADTRQELDELKVSMSSDHQSDSASRPSPHTSSYDPRGPVCWRCGIRGHIRAYCRQRIDHLRRPYSYDRGSAPSYGHRRGHNFSAGRSELSEEELVGNSNETPIVIESLATQALLDTGSSVSTVSQPFYEANLKHLECANDHGEE